MRLALVVLALSSCTSHNRFTAAGTFGPDGSALGGEGSLTGASGDDGVMVVAQATGYGGQGLDGGSILFGLEGYNAAPAWGFRAGATAGPAFISRADEIDLSLEGRASVAVFLKFDPSSDEHQDTAETLGLELFVANVGLHAEGNMIGLGITVGRMATDHMHSIAASRRARRHLLASRP